MEAKEYLLYVAIDFGTAYSGYAFSTRNKLEKSPPEIWSPSWYDTTGQMASLKTSTCILFRPDGTFHSFGYKAEGKYVDLAEDDEHEDWFFFKRFKMALYNKMTVDRNTELKSVNGKTMSIMKVFSSSIKYLKDEVLNMSAQQGNIVQESDTRWVITVPAIWTDSAKAFMRQSAMEAGIRSEHLLLCLEPDAAAIYTMVDKSDSFRAGFKYIFCDAGGGTVDITVLQLQENGKIKELHQAKGGNCGGTNVDNEFERVMCKVFGSDVMMKFKKENQADFFNIFMNFELKKRLIEPDMNSTTVIVLPATLSDIFKKLNNGKEIISIFCSDKIKRDLSTESNETMQNVTPNALSDPKQYITYIAGKLKIKPALARLFFQQSKESVCNILKEILDENEINKDVDTILLVGGYSESPMLQAYITDSFPSKKVIVPQEAGLSVVKGAVIYGHDPNIFTERKSRYTYGIHVTKSFVKGEHNPDYKFTDERGVVRCDNIFRTHIRQNDTVKVGAIHSNKHMGFGFHRERNTYPVYYSTVPDPKYVTDDSCTKLGDVVIDIPLSDLDIFKDEVSVQFSFNGAELEIKVIFEKTDQTAKSFFKFET